MSEVKFTAAIHKVQTLVDGGVRVTMDLPESALVQMVELAAFQLVEYMRADGWNVFLTLFSRQHPDSKRVIAQAVCDSPESDKHGRLVDSNEETMPLAVCRLFLQIYEGQNGNVVKGWYRG